jgi:hypothetical protein
MSSLPEEDRTHAALLIAGWSPSPRPAPVVADEEDPMTVLRTLLDEVGTVSAARMFNVDHDTVLSWQDGIFPRREIWARLAAVTGTTFEQWARAAARDREARWASATDSSCEESPVDGEEHDP